MADPAGSLVRLIGDISLDGMGDPEPLPPLPVGEPMGPLAEEPPQAVVADLPVGEDLPYLLV
jgi:hypothetical protein